MSVLNIWNSFSLVSNGLENNGKQGSTTDDMKSPFAITVTGTTHRVVGQLATATVVTVYDDDDDVPADWDYLYYWADQITYLQIIGSGSNVIFKIAAKQPFVLPGYDSILAAANTTVITGGTEPTLTDIDSILIGNYSGSTANYLFTVVD